MNIEESELDKLCKVLALTKSDKPGEALAAFQSARRLLLRQGLSFEDVIAQYFDDSGMSPQEQISALKKQKMSLQRELNEQARELKEHKEAVKDLLDQIWELREGNTLCAPKAEPAAPIDPAPKETIQETFRPNLIG
ncbi:MAG: hypothetical protein ISR45_02535 [Rhodospirillales bacterium]|nr:hypothetical protein [Rhodospirillales bacterium]